jgi:hypothetical protein
MTISRTESDRYAVVTDTVLADGSFRADHHMALAGNELRSVERRGAIRTGGLLRVALGPLSLARVMAMSIGDSISFTK